MCEHAMNSLTLVSSTELFSQIMSFCHGNTPGTFTWSNCTENVIIGGFLTAFVWLILGYVTQRTVVPYETVPFADFGVWMHFCAKTKDE